ncbi:DAK2 domain-containing protein [Caldalkalibacillus salinus]|uniref:DAK2 domain-containing protein n=1 Tax=Caldalkalibacillus salinus TaxID=2803787 RepID=UPI00192127AC|nr:DAK2 domain-containing protein [Caldalkalibacillus salinus]
MIQEGAKNLTKHVKTVDSLNVFPVPDGDTGTNMNLSFTSGVNEMNKVSAQDISQVAKALSRGLLMGARGNSGVILSQLFRGFGKAIEEEDAIDSKLFAKALRHGVETAYKAVMKPVEGTILTVSKDAAEKADKAARQTDDITEVMAQVLEEAKASLQRTPDLLPVLKQVGVVDSGGQGLVYVYEGFLAVLKGESLPEHHEDDVEDREAINENKEEHVRDEVAEMMQSGVLSVEDIEFGYCTEFMVRLSPERAPLFNEQQFRQQLTQFGDSLLVISDDELVKVHIHAEELYKVMELAQRFGDLTNIKIENMREQFIAIKDKEGSSKQGQATTVENEETEQKEYGLITVAMGQGIEDIFTSLGADVVIQGGQTMNPSTEDFVNAAKQMNAQKIMILPNNSNIILAAEQAGELIDVPVVVIPTKNVPQGMASLLSYNPTLSLEENREAMNQAKDHVKAGQVTYAVRDTEIDGVHISKDDFMGLYNGKIVATDKDRDETLRKLIAQLCDEESEILTLIYGEDVTEEEAETLAEDIEQAYEEIEVEIHKGDQPLYPFILAVE